MKRIVIIAMMAGLTLNLVAQWEIGGTDTLTVGSKAKYWSPASITPVAGVMNASRFNWYFTNASDVTITAGITVDEPQVGGNYAADSIHVSFAAGTYPATTNIKVKTAEISQPVFGTGCTGSVVEAGIRFVGVPSVTLNSGSDGGCVSAVTGLNVPVAVNGYGPFVVTFTVRYNGGGAVTHTATLGSVSSKGANSFNLNLTTATHLNSGAGVYTVDVTNVTDRFSRKSLTAIPGNVTNGTYSLGINPAPTTSPIRHIRNL